MRTKSTSSKNCTFGIIPTSCWRVMEVTPLDNYCLNVKFLDGLQGLVNILPLISSNKAGVFEALKDKDYFNQVYVAHGVVTWPGELDLAPDAMYEEIKKNGEWIIG